jgi:hypothetical protein
MSRRTELHQRVPVILGSKSEVERVAATTLNTSAARSRKHSIRRCSRTRSLFDERLNQTKEAPMSVKHPIIAITGSSGAGTIHGHAESFEHIFRREKLKCRRSSRAIPSIATTASPCARDEGAWRATTTSAISGPKPTCSKNSETCSSATARPASGKVAQIPARR